MTIPDRQNIACYDNDPGETCPQCDGTGCEDCQDGSIDLRERAQQRHEYLLELKRYDETL